MGASLSTTEGRMTANERADWKRATDQKRAIIRRALDRIIATPGILFIYVKFVLNNIPCSTTTTITTLPLFLLAGAFMVMTVYQTFFSLKKIGECMARERFRRERNNGVKTQKLSSFLRFTSRNLMVLLAFSIYGFVFLILSYIFIKPCP